MSVYFLAKASFDYEQHVRYPYHAMVTCRSHCREVLKRFFKLQKYSFQKGFSKALHKSMNLKMSTGSRWTWSREEDGDDKGGGSGGGLGGWEGGRLIC